MRLSYPVLQWLYQQGLLMKGRADDRMNETWYEGRTGWFGHEENPDGIVLYGPQELRIGAPTLDS